MPGSTVHSHSKLSALVGKLVVGVSRILFEHDGEIDGNDGPLELLFSDGDTLLLDGEADGERLRVRFQSWKDPFKEPLSRENRRYVEECGRWRKVDCSEEAKYSGMLGRRVSRVDLLENEFGTPAGLAITLDDFVLWFTVSGDEARVHWAQPIGFRRAVVPDS